MRATVGLLLALGMVACGGRSQLDPGTLELDEPGVVGPDDAPIVGPNPGNVPGGGSGVDDRPDQIWLSIGVGYVDPPYEDPALNCPHVQFRTTYDSSTFEGVVNHVDGENGARVSCHVKSSGSRIAASVRTNGITFEIAGLVMADRATGTGTVTYEDTQQHVSKMQSDCRFSVSERSDMPVLGAGLLFTEFYCPHVLTEAGYYCSFSGNVFMRDCAH